MLKVKKNHEMENAITRPCNLKGTNYTGRNVL